MIQYVFRQEGEQPKLSVKNVKYHDQIRAEIHIIWSISSVFIFFVRAVDDLRNLKKTT